MVTQLASLKDECYGSEIESDFPQSLKLLEEFRRVKIYDKSFLEDVTILFIQHHLSPFIGRLEVMKEDGMISQDTWFIDIPYSTNEAVKNEIINRFTHHKYPEPYSDPIENYSNFQIKRTMSVIKRIIETNPKKILVVDDGAYFIRAIYNLSIINSDITDRLRSKIYLVEQTTRGHRYLKDKKYNMMISILDIPIVSIARSKTKLVVESPFIGIACRRAIEENERIVKLIDRFNSDKKKQISIGIIGYGSIGESVFEGVRNLIEPPCKIDIVEINFKKWNEIKANGGNPISELPNKKYNILFGCTGYKAFGWRDRKKVSKDGLLVSVSSASIEFSRGNYIEYSNLYPDDPIEIIPTDSDKGIHSDLLFKDGHNEFYFVNSGFPINFTGKRECLPLKFIQPTHALLYAASYQVLNQPRLGLRKIRNEYDNWLYYNAFNYL